MPEHMLSRHSTHSCLNSLKAPRYFHITPPSCPLCPHILDQQVKGSIGTVSTWTNTTQCRSDLVLCRQRSRESSERAALTELDPAVRFFGLCPHDTSNNLVGGAGELKWKTGRMSFMAEAYFHKLFGKA